MSRKGCTKENFYKGKILSLQPAATMRLQISAAATMRLQIGAASPCAVSQAQQTSCASNQAHPTISSAAQSCASSSVMCIQPSYVHPFSQILPARLTWPSRAQLCAALPTRLA
ncbi:hypothetical protein M6B38_220035 [Iris pallida]|uniref:Uncharacterized protein n=1 Tax=Iris pallida TaxID=29817 RepID=A0AAX6DY82_IRIPA|nr:hypothetical protein M6B38_220035 [Iris pallida]